MKNLVIAVSVVAVATTFFMKESDGPPSAAPEKRAPAQSVAAPHPESPPDFAALDTRGTLADGGSDLSEDVLPERINLAAVASEIRREEARRTEAAWRDHLWTVYRELGVDSDVLQSLADIGRTYAEDLEALFDQMRDPGRPLVDLSLHGAFDPVQDLSAAAADRIASLLGPDILRALDEEKVRFLEENADAGVLPGGFRDAPLLFVPAD